MNCEFRTTLSETGKSTAHHFWRVSRRLEISSKDHLKAASDVMSAKSKSPKCAFPTINL
jgi:hypothetical protein